MGCRSISANFNVLSKYRPFLYGCSALWILLYHCSTRIPAKGILIPFYCFQTIGNCGVEIFLLLCGFGLYYSMEKDSRIFSFYKKRVLRVFLPSLLALSAFYIVNDSSLLTYLGSSTLIGYWFGIPTVWYAAFILTMYIFYPLIYALQKKRNKNIVILFVLALVFSFLTETFQIVDKEVQRGISRIPVFLLGCLIAPAVIRKKPIPNWLIPSTFGLAIPLSALWLFAQKYGYQYFFRSLAYISYAVLIIACLCLIAWLLTKYTVLHGVYRCIAFVGGISLEIYLVFERVLGLLKQLSGFYVHPCGGVKMDIAAAVLTLILAVLLQTVTKNIINAVQSCPVPETNVQQEHL